MSEIIELSTITLKDGFSSPPQSLLDDLKTLASTPGVIALYFGPHLETPYKYTWVARWSSQTAIDNFHTSPGFADWAASYVAPLATYAVSACTAYTGDAAVPLEAPCTEFFSSFGADDDYLDARLNPFVKALDDAKLPGMVGGITGEFVPLNYVGVEQPEPKVVLLLLGWNSMADHQAQRGEGKVIDNNIHLVRSGRKSVGMFHVNLQKL
ncbi:uncharacterized protein TRIVIDRAFT_43250 [Trichoderma virens Gv29-8]|uniref:ABM domain-containing protein n=1 Tax=Hypocrea virens (strain Gv29-8 / FGSC 10586) TaxID=413071 RepID=G9N763_HYPVG|nr:uncharacterized protein TRIVIDRAFT_43250 [Trichoderma virens Gv29-8]EHK17561.1 hypothetical protein TRIVIDRAFT_43250 [Trichoderma virens Gv29-8]UKZ53719.1 hypothetical protein TrVGV298_007516 [Trichoderma virens]